MLVFSTQQFRHDSTVHVGQRDIASAESERQRLVIKSELMQNRRVDVVNRQRVLDDLVAELVGRSER